MWGPGRKGPLVYGGRQEDWEDGSLEIWLIEGEKQYIWMSVDFGMPAPPWGCTACSAWGWGDPGGPQQSYQARGSCSSLKGCPAATESEGQGLASRLCGMDHSGWQVVSIPGW